MDPGNAELEARLLALQKSDLWVSQKKIRCAHGLATPTRSCSDWQAFHFDTTKNCCSACGTHNCSTVDIVKHFQNPVSKPIPMTSCKFFLYLEEEFMAYEEH